jgi:hypothetical protein
MTPAELREYRAALRASRNLRRDSCARLKRRKLHAPFCLSAQAFVDPLLCIDMELSNSLCEIIR